MPLRHQKDGAASQHARRAKQQHKTCGYAGPLAVPPTATLGGNVRRGLGRVYGAAILIGWYRRGHPSGGSDPSMSWIAISRAT